MRLTYSWMLLDAHGGPHRTSAVPLLVCHSAVLLWVRNSAVPIWIRNSDVPLSVRNQGSEDYDAFQNLFLNYCSESTYFTIFKSP